MTRDKYFGLTQIFAIIFFMEVDSKTDYYFIV